MLKFYDEGIGAFTQEELDRLEHYCDGLPATEAGFNNALPGGQFDRSIRSTRTATIQGMPEIVWFFERLMAIVRTFNDRSYHFDLRGLFEAPQFLVYRAAEAGHYDWHLDIGRVQPRKLSVTIQLTDPSHYEGGELQFNIGSDTLSTPKARGAVIVFPSYMVHRVTPVTSGVRKAIVAWITGPEFK